MHIGDEVVVVLGLRTAIVKIGGKLKGVASTGPGTTGVREVLARTDVSGEEVGHGVFGNAIAIGRCSLKSTIEIGLFRLPRDPRQHLLTNHRIPARYQRFAGASNIPCFLILAELAFADQPRDIDLQTHNGLGHRI